MNPLTPTSDAQARATENGTLPPLERVRDRVWVLALAMPGAQPRLGYTLTYLLIDEEERVHVVDPGWDSDENRAALRQALEAVPSRGDVASVIVTHLHPDHLGMAPRLRAATGATLVLHEREADALRGDELFQPADPAGWGVPADRYAELALPSADRAGIASVVPDVVVRGDVDHLRPPGLPIEVIHTPGHTTGSICLRLPEERLLITGDHILPAVHPGLGLGGAGRRNPIAEYLDSLGRVVGYDDHEILPGHNYRFTGLADRVAQIAAHHRRRTGEVARAVADRPAASVYEVAATLTWTAGWQRMRGFFFYSALAQTAMHIDFLRTAEHDRSTAGSSA